MATSSGGQSPTVVQVSQKPSIRKRLFSSTSKKSAKLAKDTSDAPVPDLPPASQNPANDSTTTTSEPLNSADQGQGPSPHVHGSASPDHKTHLTTPPPETRTDDMDRERSSVNTTLTANRRTPFYRRKANKSSTSEGALSSSGSHSVIKIATGLSRPKPSFLSRVVQKVVPCVGPIPDGPPQSRDDDVSRTPESRPSLALKDLSTVKHPDPVVNSQAVDDVNSPNDVQSGLTIPIINMLPSLSQAETEVLIPPPPTMQLQPEDETDGMTSGAVQPPGSTGNQILRTHVRDRDDPEASITDDEMDQTHIRNEQEEEERLIKNGGSGIPIGPDGIPKPLLPPIAPQHAGRKCLVLDLDETLVHSSFRAVQQADFIVPVEIEYHWHHFHVLKRPGVDNFLKKMGEIYELVVFTASLSKYADPVLDKLDIHHVVAHRLFRESCYSHKGNYVKDLSQLGRPIADTIILDNSPASYIFHPYNAVPVSSWFNDPHDAELTDLIPFLTDLTFVHDVRGVLDGAR